MELKEFISESLKQITDGIIEGNKYIGENKHGQGVDGSRIKIIQFDVAVTLQDKSLTGKAGKITVANVFSAGANKEAKTNVQ